MFTKRHDLYHHFTPLRGNVITIEGGVGVGKTSLGNTSERYLNLIGIRAKFFPEYVNDTLLSQFINDMDRYAYPFELFMLAKRAEIYREAQRFAESGGVAIIDRSINGDWAFTKMQYDAGRITDQDWETYQAILKSEDFYEPALTVVLNCTPERSMERIITRGRGCESGYTLEYLQLLKKAYEESLEEVTHQVSYFDWGEDKKIDEDGYLSDEDVVEFLTNLWAILFSSPATA